jgi:hypothetical protein
MSHASPTTYPDPVSDPERCRTIFAAGCVAAVTTLVWTWLGLRLEYPYLFADETVFLQHAWDSARATGEGWRAALRSPSPLHSLLFSGVFGSEPNMLASVRTLNALACGLSVLPAVALARRFVGAGASLAFGAFVGLNPWNCFSANFLPESLYGFVFWCLAWMMVGAWPVDGGGRKVSILRPVSCGLAVAVLFFVKSHALTLVLVCAIVFVLRGVRALRTSMPEAWWRLGESVVFLVVVFSALQLLASAGDRTLSDVVFAGRYRSEAGGLLQATDAGATVGHLLRQTIGTLGHLGVLYCVPFAVLPTAFRAAWGRREAESERRADLAAFALPALVLTLLFSAKFISDLEVRGSVGMIDRLIERYYGHLLPLAVLVLFADGPSSRRGFAKACAVGCALCSLVVIAWSERWGFLLLAYDAPAFYWMNPFELEPRAVSTWWLVCVVGMGVAHLAAFLFWKRYDWRVFVMLALPVQATAIYGVQQQSMRTTRDLSTLHEYAAMTRHLIESDWERTIVVGDEFRVAAFRVMLWATPRTIVVAEGQRVPASRIPGDVRWIVRLNTSEPSDGVPTETVFRGAAHGTFEIARRVDTSPAR